MLTKRELASVLTGLRLLQEHESLGDYLAAIATDTGSFARLTAEEIDALCETINGAFAVGERVYVDAGNWAGEGEVIANGPAHITVKLDATGYVLTTTHDNVNAIEPGLGERTLQSFHFNLGNSSDGPVGYCARVTAYTPAEAVKLLREALPADREYKVLDNGSELDEPGVEYIAVYVNPDAVTAAAIDESEEV